VAVGSPPEHEAVTAEAARRLEAIRQEQEGQASEFQLAIETRDATFPMELDTAAAEIMSVRRRDPGDSHPAAQLIAAEVRKLIDAALQLARRILAAQRSQLEKVAQSLLQRETLTGEEISTLLEAASGRGQGPPGQQEAAGVTQSQEGAPVVS
jgi:cell division protease FtsH